VTFTYDEYYNPTEFRYVNGVLGRACQLTTDQMMAKQGVQHLPSLSCAAAKDIMEYWHPELFPSSEVLWTEDEIITFSMVTVPYDSTLVLPSVVNLSDFLQSSEAHDYITSAVSDASGADISDVNIQSADPFDLSNPGDALDASTLLSVSSHPVTAPAPTKQTIVLTVTIKSNNTDNTQKYIRGIRHVRKMNAFLAQLCAEFHCTTSFTVLEIGKDHVHREHRPAAQEAPNAVRLDCQKYSGYSVELCLHRMGCFCSSAEPREGATLCLTCEGEHYAGLSRLPGRGDDYEPAELDGRDERALVGRWRRTGGGSVLSADEPDTMLPHPSLRQDSTGPELEASGPVESGPRMMPEGPTAELGPATSFDRNGMGTHMAD
jgi:hypothetical protein